MSKPDLKPVDLESAIRTEIFEAVSDLTFQNWKEINRVLSETEDRKITVSFSVNIERSGGQPRVKTSISFSEKFKDERDVYVKDPRQTELGLKSRGEE